jgi:hypothetical protein
MPDKTDSYCERCGTRYVFRVDANRNAPLKRVRIFARGLRNFLLQDGESINDALALARRDDEAGDTTRLSDAFQRTFNFCLSCRMYACDKCWNASQGACRTCAPETGHQPVAPTEHLIVRTPTARRDSAVGADGQWLFPQILGDGHVSVSPQSTDPAEVDAAPVPPFDATSGAWPAQDLANPLPPAGAIDESSKPTVAPVMRTAVTIAPTQWPAADLAGPEPDPAASLAAPAQLLEPALSEIEGWLATAGLGPDPEPTPVAAFATVPESEPEPVTPPSVEAPKAASLTPEVTAPTSVAATTAFRPAAPNAAPIPAMGRILRRITSATNVVAAIDQSRTNDAEPRLDPWPRPTPWADRPLRPLEWSLAAGSDVGVALGTGDPKAAQISAYVSAPAGSAAIAPSGALEAETRTSAAQIAAVSELGVAIDAQPESAPQTPAVEAAPRPDAETANEDAPQGPAVEAAREPTRDVPLTIFEIPTATDDAPVRRLEPVAWPPLGARWPSRASRGEPWPGPKSTVLPALAAQKDSSQFVTQIWVQSSQEVLNRGSVRVCHHCTLPVSTQARFCRRCGTKQA